MHLDSGYNGINSQILVGTVFSVHSVAALHDSVSRASVAPARLHVRLSVFCFDRGGTPARRCWVRRPTLRMEAEGSVEEGTQTRSFFLPDSALCAVHTGPGIRLSCTVGHRRAHNVPTGERNVLGQPREHRRCGRPLQGAARLGRGRRVPFLHDLVKLG